MKFIAIVLILPIFIYLVSFAVYNWKKNNKLAAVGAAIIGIAAYTLPIYILFLSKVEL